MSRLETSKATWADLKGLSQKNGADRQTVTAAGARSEHDRDAWQAVIDHSLHDWEKDPSALEDEGAVAPSADVMQRACRVARQLCDAGLPPPHRVAATGDGGIVFARQEGPLLSTLEIDADGSVELAVFRNARLVTREHLG